MKNYFRITAGVMGIFLCLETRAQITTFQKTVGGSGTDYAYDAHVAPTGGFVFGGITTSFPLSGSVNSYVVKTDDKGDTLWTTAYIGTGGNCDNQYVNDLCPLADGGVVAVGGKALCGDTTKGGNIVRLDASGNVIWSKYSNKYADPYPVIQCNDGNIIVGGYETDGGFQSSKDALLMKLDIATGDTLWCKRYGGSGDDWFYHILQTPDNGYLSAGFTTSFGQGGRDIYIVKTDANGNYLWSKAYGTTGYESAFGHSIDPTTDGGFILAGQSDNGAQSAKGAFLMKIDGSGNMSWAKYYPCKHGHGVKQTPDKGFILAGAQTPNNFLIKTDSLGTIEFAEQYSGGDGLILDMCPDGGYLCGGASNISGTMDVYMVKTDANGLSGCSESALSITATNAPFITVSPATQVIQGAKTVSYPLQVQHGSNINSLCLTLGKQERTSEIKVEIFPNPSNGIFTIQTQPGIPLHIEIVDELGRIVLKKDILNLAAGFDMRGFTKGMYSARVYKDGIYVTCLKFVTE